jgi:hypothetical protein
MVNFTFCVGAVRQRVESVAALRPRRRDLSFTHRLPAQMRSTAALPRKHPLTTVLPESASRSLYLKPGQTADKV